MEFAVPFLERLEGFQVDIEPGLCRRPVPRPKRLPLRTVGLEGRSGPEIERLGGLHVIVPVEKDGRLPGASRDSA